MAKIPLNFHLSRIEDHYFSFLFTFCSILALYLVWTCIAVTLTLIAWTLQIVPLEHGASSTYAPFFMLTNFKFVAMISIPYLFMLGIAVTCDVIALTIAIMRKKKLMTPKTSKQHTNSSNFSTGNTQDIEKHHFLNIVFKGIVNCKQMYFASQG